MKKKFLAFLLTLCFIVPSSLMFSACSNTEDGGVSKYKITVIQSANGVIAPDFVLDSNTIELTEGSSYTFYIAANEGYKIENLIIDGNVVAASSTYTFDNIKDNHTIAATFEIKENIESLKLRAIKINYRTARTDSAVSISALQISQNYLENNGYDFIYGIGSVDITNEITSNVGYMDGNIRMCGLGPAYVVNDIKFFGGVANLNILCKNGANSSANYGEINESVAVSVNELIVIESCKFETLYSYTVMNSSNNFITSLELVFSLVD